MSPMRPRLIDDNLSVVFLQEGLGLFNARNRFAPLFVLGQLRKQLPHLGIRCFERLSTQWRCLVGLSEGLAVAPFGGP
jgi:hypothetical protein